MPPTEDSVDSYLDSLERLLFATSGASLFDVDIEGIEEAFNRLWNDIEHGHHRVAPTEIIQIQIPSLAELEARFSAEESARAVANVSETGCTSFGVLDKITRWIGKHKCLVFGLILGFAWLAYKRRRRLGYVSRRVRRHFMKESGPKAINPKPSIFIVGGSHPFASQLTSRLSTLGYSVFSDSTYPFMRNIYENESQPEGDFYRTLLKDAIRQNDDAPYPTTVQSIISLSHLPPLVSSESSSDGREGDTRDNILFGLPPASSYTPYLNNTSIIPTKRLFDIIDVLFSFQQTGGSSGNFLLKKKKNVIVCVPGTSNASKNDGNSESVLQKASVAATLAAVNGLRDSMASPNAVQRFGPTSFKTVSVDLNLSDPKTIPAEDMERFVSLITRTVSPGFFVSEALNGRGKSLGSCVYSVGLRARMMPLVLMDWWRGSHLYIGPSRLRQVKLYAKDTVACCEDYAKAVIIYTARMMISGLRLVLDWVDDRDELDIEEKGQPTAENIEAETKAKDENSLEQSLPAGLEGYHRSPLPTPDFLTGDDNNLSLAMATSSSSQAPDIQNMPQEDSFILKSSQVQKVYDKHAQTGSVSEQLTTSIERLRAMSRTMTELSGRETTLGDVTPVEEERAVANNEDEDENVEVASSWVSLSDDERHH